MSNLLFTEVSVEQQEIVAGGGRNRRNTVNLFAKNTQTDEVKVKFEQSAGLSKTTFSFEKYRDITALTKLSGPGSLLGF